MRNYLKKLKNALDNHPTTKNVLKKIYWFFCNLIEEIFNVVSWCIRTFLPLALLSYLFYLCFSGTLDKVSARVSCFYNIELKR